MANEINTNMSVGVNFNSQSVNGSYNGNADLTTGFIGSEQIVTTSAATLDLGNVGAAPVFVFIRNLDATNYVTVDSASAMTSFPQKILPGKAIYMAPQTGTIYAKANTATCNVFVCAAG